MKPANPAWSWFHCPAPHLLLNNTCHLPIAAIKEEKVGGGGGGGGERIMFETGSVIWGA